MQVSSKKLMLRLEHALGLAMVLKHAPCPAALVECGFVSNGIEARKLLDPEYRRRIANALAEGIVAYFDTVRFAQPIRSTSPASAILPRTTRGAAQ